MSRDYFDDAQRDEELLTEFSTLDMPLEQWAEILQIMEQRRLERQREQRRQRILSYCIVSILALAVLGGILLQILAS